MAENFSVEARLSKLEAAVAEVHRSQVEAYLLHQQLLSVVISLQTTFYHIKSKDSDGIPAGKEYPPWIEKLDQISALTDAMQKQLDETWKRLMALPPVES